MPLPKYRHSKQRGRKRRTHWRHMAGPRLMDCSHCHQPKLTHRVCPNCGYYDGREVYYPREG